MKTLNVLFVEDENHDAELVAYNLRNVAKVTQTETRARFEKSLADSQWDVVLMDFKLPDMNIEEAIQISKRLQPECPVILLTGSVGDHDAAATAVKHGAICHFLKDRIEGLPLAVQAAYEGRELRAQTIRNDRLEILGHLSTGVSHDLNNTLQVVLSGIELLRQKINPMDMRVIDAMERAAKLGAEMIAQLLVFSRGSEGSAYKPISMEYLFGELNQILKSGSFPNIRTSIYISPGTSKVLCDATQLQQVALNLCVNSRDAMPSGGEIRISAQNVSHVDGEQFAINGDFVLITFQDSGHGIPDEALPRIFDAFFSLKPQGKGTGMGLAIVKSIIDAHGGVIQVQSSKQGTTFSIYLPAAEDVQPVIRTQELVGHGKTVIVGEDEETLRFHLQLHLEAAGYRVLTAANGAEILAHFRVGEKIDAIVSDCLMPVMGGMDVVDNLRSMNIQTPIIFITGSDAMIAARSDAAVLQKPFTTAAMLKALKDVLSSSA